MPLSLTKQPTPAEKACCKQLAPHVGQSLTPAKLAEIKADLQNVEIIPEIECDIKAGPTPGSFRCTPVMKGFRVAEKK